MAALQAYRAEFRRDPTSAILSRLAGTSERAVAQPHSATYKKVVVTRYGGPETIAVVEEPLPEPKPGQVRVKVLAAGVSLPDIMARQGVHPETPPLPFTPGWDLVGIVDRLGDCVRGFAPGQVVAAMPISGAYAQFVCLAQEELVPVPAGVDPAAAVSLVLNYITAYQMLHRFARVQRGQRVLIHGAAGGVGTALLQLGRLAGLELYATCSAQSAAAVAALGATPIDYRGADFVQEIWRLTGDGVDAVFDPIGGAHLWESRKALRDGGKVVGYGNTSSLRGAGLTPSRPGRRNRLHGVPGFALYVAAAWLLPGRRRILPYSIQWLKRWNPAMFAKDLAGLLELLRERKIQPLITHRLPLEQARHAQELLARGGITGKIVLECQPA